MSAGAGEPRVCADCARRSWLLERLAGHLEPVRARIAELLELGDEPLIAAVAGEHRDAILREAAGHDLASLRDRVARAGLSAVCRCDAGYPAGLRALPAPPAVVFASGPIGRLAASLGGPAVAVVGARGASAYGREVAGSLSAELATAGLTVVSGMALGIDGAAHAGALDAGDPGGPTGPPRTVAVLAGGADVAYPAGHRRLHARIRQRGLAVSELGPGVAPRRWMFTARNRIIAGLSEMTIIVQARERSGALLTVDWARRLGRHVGAVPGPVTTALSAGPHLALRQGATLVAGAQDALDALYGAGAVTVAERRQDTLEPALAALVDALADGEGVQAACQRAGLSGEAGLAALAGLELDGVVRRDAGGRWVVR